LIPEDVWICVDFVLEEEYYELALVLENKNGEQLLINLDMVDGRYGYSWIVEKSHAEMYRKMYGENNWKLILDGEVRIGMTREMCRLSWGTPYDIHRTLSKNVDIEQWVYQYSSGRYLYFEDGKLKVIQ